MTEKQPVQSATKDHTPVPSPDIIEQGPESSPLLSGLLQGQALPPPGKPRPGDVLHLQRTIGNSATQRYLNSRVPISSGASKLHLQRDRVVEEDIELTVPPEIMSYEAFVQHLSMNRALRSRMMARTDGGEHIRSILRDHSNLQDIYRQITMLNTAGGDTGAFALHIRFQYRDGPGTSQEQVDHIDFSLPGVTVLDYEDDRITVSRPDPAEPDFGLETSESRAIFVDESMTSLIRDWPGLSARQRREETFALINRRLAVRGMPAVDGSPVARLSPGTNAQFDGAAWAIEYVESRFEVTDAAAINHILSDFYHEARHAEQVFLALRYLYDAVYDLNRLRLIHYRQDVCDAAVAANTRSPLRGRERVEARQYYEIYFSDQVATSEVYAELDAAAEDLQAIRGRHGTPEEITAAERRYRLADRAYRALSSEADAYDVGNEVLEQLEASNPTDTP